MLINLYSGKILILIFIALFALEDFRYKSIRIRDLAVALFLELIIYLYISLWKYRINLKEIVFGASIGLLVWVIAKVFKDFIGEGDGIFFIIMGIAIGYDNLIILLMISFFIASLFSLMIIMYSIFKHKSYRRLNIPLIPFIIPAYMLLLV